MSECENCVVLQQQIDDLRVSLAAANNQATHFQKLHAELVEYIKNLPQT